jgi:hypothetical protein
MRSKEEAGISDRLRRFAHAAEGATLFRPTKLSGSPLSKFKLLLQDPRKCKSPPVRSEEK